MSPEDALALQRAAGNKATRQQLAQPEEGSSGDNWDDASSAVGDMSVGFDHVTDALGDEGIGRALDAGDGAKAFRLGIGTVESDENAPFEASDVREVATGVAGGLGWGASGALGAISAGQTLTNPDATKLEKVEAGGTLASQTLTSASGLTAAGESIATAFRSGEQAGEVLGALSGTYGALGYGADVFAKGAKGTKDVHNLLRRRDLGGKRTRFASWKRKARGNRRTRSGKTRLAWEMGKSSGRAATRMSDAAKAATLGVGTAADIAKTVGASSAGSVATTASTVVPGLSMALGGAQVVKGAYNIGRKTKRRRTLTKMVDQERSAAGFLGEMRTDSKGNVYNERVAALKHLHEIQKKKQKRAAIDIAAGAMAVTSGALAVSGVGAIPAAVVGGAAGALKLGQLGLRAFKQRYRDKVAHAMDKKAKLASGDLSSDEHKLGAGQKSWLRFHKAMSHVKLGADVQKTSARKAERNRATSKELLDMYYSTDPAEKANALKALKTVGVLESDFTKTEKVKQGGVSVRQARELTRDERDQLLRRKLTKR